MPFQQRGQHENRPTPNFQPQRSQPPANKMDEATCRRKQGLCFCCKKPWEPCHYCLGKAQLHLVELIPNEESETESELVDFAEFIMEQKSPQPPEDNANDGGNTLATISGASMFLTMKVKGKVAEDQIIMLIDGGATLNFIDADYVTRKKLTAESFASFKVANANGQISICDQVVK